MLKVQALTKSFGALKAVNNCSFNIDKRKISALIGPNGSGKTTLFNIVTGFIRADNGKIFLENKEISDLGPEEISNLGVSRLFQQSRLFKNLTIKDNLLLPFDGEDTKLWKNLFGFNKITIEKKIKINELLRSFDLEGEVDFPAKDLSYGQKRLIEILRSIIKPHKLLILDEPVAGVNPKLKNKIAEILRALREEGETIFLIEHDMGFTTKIADEIIVMDEGRIIAIGKPGEIKQNDKVIKAYLG